MKNIYYCTVVKGLTLSTMKCYPDLISFFDNRKDCIEHAKAISSKSGMFPKGTLVLMYTRKYHEIMSDEQRYFYQGKEISVFDAKAITEEL